VAGLTRLANADAYNLILLNPLPGATGPSPTTPEAINDAGQVVGTSPFGATNTHAVIWNGGIPTDLGTLGGNNSQAFGINNAGQIVGTAGPQGNRATIWNGGTPTFLGSRME
jgi:probable HAF family extracellular repeat protein